MTNYPAIISTSPTYTPFPSAFEIIEKPLRYCHDRIEPKKDWEAPSNQDCLMYLGGMAAYPFVFCAAPLTMTADIVTGIAESIFCICRGFKLRDVAQLAKKKIIISPLHHLSFVAVNLGLPSLLILTLSLPLLPSTPKHQILSACTLLAGIGLYCFSNPLVDEADQAKALKNLPKIVRQIVHRKEVFVVTNVALAVFAYSRLSILLFPRDIASLAVKFMLPMLSIHWMIYYTISQRLIGSFSAAYNHNVFSIFKDGGAKDKKDQFNRTYQDRGFSGVSLEDWDLKAEGYYQNYRSSYHSSNSSDEWTPGDWKAFLKSDFDKIKATTHQKNSLYQEFKTRVLGNKPPLELLGLSSIYTKEDVIKAFRKYSRAVFPDKNEDKLEAAALFKCLSEARYQLDPEARPIFTAREPEKKNPSPPQEFSDPAI